LTEPIHEADFVAGRVESAVPQIFTFYSGNYKKMMKVSVGYFNQQGWNSYVEALERSRIIEHILQKKQALTSHITGTAQLCKQGVEGNTYYWYFEAPFEMTYVKAAHKTTVSEPITVIVARSNAPDNEQKIAIQQFVIGLTDNKPCGMAHQIELKEAH
jgi:intracellular multiplication protein IcmL